MWLAYAFLQWRKRRVKELGHFYLVIVLHKTLAVSYLKLDIGIFILLDISVASLTLA